MFLNAIFEWTASGETFNFKGKTDILVNYKSKNLFIAECKMWEGPKYHEKSIDQILTRYTSWRDSKLAILIFNKKNKNFTALTKKIDEITKSHKNYCEEYKLKSQNLAEEGVYSYKFVHPVDEDRSILLTVMTFNFFIPGTDE